MLHRAVAAPDDRGIRVAFISRRVLHDATEIRIFPDGLLPVQVGDDPPGPPGPRTMNQMGRPALRVTVRANNRDVHIVCTHLKSKLLTFPGGSFTPVDEDQRARFAAYALYRRASEATTLRMHLDQLLDGGGREMPVILAGDMNDEVEAGTTLILNGPPGSEIGSTGFDQPDRGDGDRMWNLAPLIPLERRFTRLYRGRMELIDHIFVSNFLVAGTRTTDVTTVVAEPGMPSIEDNPNERIGEPGSDHAAVIATFDF
jgi:Endonuclease/Exonuclease/phosphatase family